MSTSFMDADTQGIGEFIQHRRFFRVPDHQRDFAWTDEEVEQFIDDVIRALQSSDEDYFLGLVVVVEPGSDEAWEILDGQQRLATTIMVYAAVREWLHAAGFEKDAIKLQDDFIGPRELGETEAVSRLTLNINNRAAFREYVVERRNDDFLASKYDLAPRHSSERLLVDAARLCRRKISKLASQTGQHPRDQANVLFDLAKYMRDRVKIVALNVASTANAYVIFETLNDRGLDLSVLDLVKNHLFGRSGTLLEEVQSNWITMLSNLSGRKSDDFLKVFWTSRWGRIQRGKLFDEWRTKYNTLASQQVTALSSELNLAADKFSALEAPDHDVWNAYSAECKKAVKTLAVLGSRQTWPVMLAALETFDTNEMERLLNHLIILTVRYQTIGKGRTGLLEIASARVAKGVFNGEFNSPQKVWNEYSQLVSGDTEFLEDFSRWEERKSARCRYVLAELETAQYKRRHRGRSPEKTVLWEELTLEHVFPVNPSNEWASEVKADPELKEEYLHRLGNLCLLQKKPNKEASSKGFLPKSENILAQSDLSLTSDIAKCYKKWTRTSIEKRQADLAELALLAWPLPHA